MTRNALSFCVCLALTCGICGYTGFLEETQGNILSNLDPSSLSANVARGMLGTTMLFVYPLESFVARHVCVVLLFEGRRAHEGEDASVLNRADRRIGLTVALYVTAVLPAALLDDLGSVLAIAGAIGGSCLSYIGPGLVYLGVHGGRFIDLVQKSWLGKMLPPEAGDATSSASAKPPVAETTPLLQRTADAEKGEAEDAAKEAQSDAQREDSVFASMLRAPVWYLTAMPLWCAMARSGQEFVHKHAEDMALKSPHPIRIGAVVYRKSQRSGSMDEKPTIERIDSGTFANRASALTGSERLLTPNNGSGGVPKSPGNINKMLGQEILRQQKEKKKAPQASERLETDPQARPPTWYDFLVAIFLILFGCLALVAGLVSLANGE